MDKKSKHKTAVKKKTLNPEFNEVHGAGKATGSRLPPSWGRGLGGGWVPKGHSWTDGKRGWEGLTGEPPPQAAGKGSGQAEPGQGAADRGEGPPRQIFGGWD